MADRGQSLDNQEPTLTPPLGPVQDRTPEAPATQTPPAQEAAAHEAHEAAVEEGVIAPRYREDSPSDTGDEGEMRRTTTEELERLLDGPEKEYDLAVAKARPAADLRWLFGMLLLLASTLVTVTYLTQYLGGLRITSTQIPNESCDLGIDDVGAFVWPAQVAACDGIVGGDAIEHLSANRQRWACPTGAANSVTAESLAADSLAADSLAADSLAADVLSDPDSDPDSSSSKKPLVQRSGVSVSNRWYGVSVLRSMLFLAIPYSMGKVAAANRRTLRLALVGLTLLLSWFLGWITFKNTRDSYDHYTCMTKLHVTDASNLTFEPLTSKLPFVLTAVDTLNLGLQLV